MISSPLRYPGGKSKLYPFFTKLLKENCLIGKEYYEPYAGGAGLALKLLANGFVKSININDIDVSIYAFWISAIKNTDKFCQLIEDTDINIDVWHKQHEIWKTCDTNNMLQLGFSTYFLNRTNRSGIIEGAGPIGGYKQKGEWKIDVRLQKKSQIENLKFIKKYADQINIHNIDAVDFTNAYIKNDNSLFYLDPPYYQKGNKLYKNFYEHCDHIHISKLLKKHKKRNWVLSYDNAPEILKAYEYFSPTFYSLNYSAGTKTIGTEVIYLSDSIICPTVPGFRNVA